MEPWKPWDELLAELGAKEEQARLGGGQDRLQRCRVDVRDPGTRGHNEGKSIGSEVRIGCSRSSGACQRRKCQAELALAAVSIADLAQD